MKKFLIILAVLLSSYGINTFANSEKYNPNRPEWNEFCPFGMENPQPEKHKFMDSVMTKYIKQDQVYWLQRKQDFEQCLNNCDNLDENDRDACYAKLRYRQGNLNNSYVSPQQRYEEHMAKMQNFSNAMNAINQQNYRRQQLNMQRQNMLLQNAPKWSDSMPKTYNVNMYHHY